MDLDDWDAGLEDDGREDGRGIGRSWFGWRLGGIVMGNGEGWLLSGLWRREWNWEGWVDFGGCDELEGYWLDLVLGRGG